MRSQTRWKRDKAREELSCAKSPVKVWRRMKVEMKIMTTVSAESIIHGGEH